VHLQQLVRRLRILPVALAILSVGLTQPPTTLLPHAVHPMVGFTFVPSQAVDQGYDPGPALSQLVRRLHPDLVRIPVYWDEVAPIGGSFDFSRVDSLLAELSAANAHHPIHPAQAILVVGVRNLAWPEVHLPTWVDTSGGLDLGRITASKPYLDYLQESFRHFGASPVLYAWQVENEPLDDTNNTLGPVAIAGGVVADEVALLKSIDPVHRVVITTYNSSNVALDMEATSSLSWLFRLLPGPQPAGHPAPTLELADVLGLDIYVDTPSTPLQDASVVERIGWKAKALSYWSAQADRSGKEVWITEMQGAPWNGEGGFSQEDLVESAQLYAGTGVTAVLLWGVESWLNAPDWMVAGQTAIATLRT
jgi:hypothetical protein